MTARPGPGPAFRLSPTIALVIIGILLGAGADAAGFGHGEIAPELILLVLLPGLVFDAAYRLRVAELRRWFGGLALLAVPGVLISALVVAIVLNLATGLRLDLAFIAGAMVSATDPAAVVATFKRLRTPPALATMVDGESLLNDGTSLVLFAIAVQAVSAPIGPADAVVTFAGTVAISGVIGLAGGFLAARITGLAGHHVTEVAISFVLAYGSYLIADQLGLSGVIATVAGGVVLGNVGPGRAMTETGADAIDRVWSSLATVLTGVVFLLVGLAIPPIGLLDSFGSIAWGIVGILVGRGLVIYVLLGGASRLPRSPGLAGAIPVGWLHVLWWAGLRGAVAVAMALALPADIPQRALLQEVTFGVVLFTLLLQGTTVGWLIDRSIRQEPTPTR